MAARWRVHTDVLQDLASAALCGHREGWIVGSRAHRTVVTITSAPTQVGLTFPAGLEVVGIFADADSDFAKAAAANHADKTSSNPWLVLDPATTLDGGGMTDSDGSNVAYDVDNLALNRDHLTLHLRMKLSWSVSAKTDGTLLPGWETLVDTSTAAHLSWLSNPDTYLVFSDSGAVVAASSCDSEDRTLGDCLKTRGHQTSSSSAGKKAKGGKSKGSKQGPQPGSAANRRDKDVSGSIVSVEMLGKHEFVAGPITSATVHLETAKGREISIATWVDVIGHALQTDTATSVCTVLVKSCAAQINAIGDELKHTLATKSIGSDAPKTVPTVVHFCPSGSPVLVTAVYPLPGDIHSDIVAQSAADDALTKHRETLHENLCRPKDRPLFRCCQIKDVVPKARKEGGRLRNPHETLKPSGVSNGTEYLTKGEYDYYHYMQDKFDDNGWGCAYRSLQTIVSWFVLQGYKTVPVPNHLEIQQMCVKNDVRKDSFVGSKEWIGSMEVGWLLQWLFTDLDIDIKYITSVQGSDVGSKGRELAQHFETNGCPVMIGGNNLAHTILGIDFNKDTGDIKFLILDPHYTGSENLKQIQDKGWCAWKGTNFWNQHTTYNMCLPQRPKVY